MSDLKYNGRLQSQHTLFAWAKVAYGPLATRQRRQFGGTSGFAMLGPDISLPGGVSNNPAVATGAIWNSVVAGGPLVTFAADTNPSYAPWVKGHLVNGQWGGRGDDWRNLTPLTAVANSNHATVEDYMRSFCHASLLYDGSGAYKQDWYGIAYLVQCSIVPFAATPSNTDLYSYAPAFIKVSWRAIQITKPNVPASQVQNHLDGVTTLQAVPTLPFTPPRRPRAIAGAVVPTMGNTPGGRVYAAAVAGYPAAQANGFDGEIEVHQS